MWEYNKLHQTNFPNCDYNELLHGPGASGATWNNVMKYLDDYTANFEQPIWNFWLVVHQGSARFKCWPSHKVFHNEFPCFLAQLPCLKTSATLWGTQIINFNPNSKAAAPKLSFLAATSFYRPVAPCNPKQQNKYGTKWNFHRAHDLVHNFPKSHSGAITPLWELL